MRYRPSHPALLIPALAWACTFPSALEEDRPPEVSLATPQGASVLRGDTVSIAVTASDSDGGVVVVWLSIDSVCVGVDSVPPYRFEWDTRGERLGRHVITAIAGDAAGRTSSRSMEVSVRWADVAPDQLDDGWATAPASAEGMDADRLRQTMDVMTAGGHEFMHALLVVRHDTLVVEEYFGGFARDSLQHLQSTTKSFTSALIGIAIDRGEIAAVSDPMFDYLPEYASLRTPDKDRITIEDCLMMAAGLAWNEISVPADDPSNDNQVGHRVGDYVAYVLAKPVIAPPGTVWYYNSGCSMALGAVLRTATGVPADAYAEQHLFGPLGIATWVWEHVNKGKNVGTHGSLYLRARDMAKFGQLFLQRGAWNGEQIISAHWVDESTRPRLTVAGDVRYGYQWWFKPQRGYDAPLTSGYGGQHIIFVPALDAVIVTAADYSNAGEIDEQDDEILRLVEQWIVPAMTPSAAPGRSRAETPPSATSATR
jgi:CubicO group peptidase (beta-lactamase class C family)